MSNHTPEFEQGKPDREGGPARLAPIGFIGLGDQGLPMAVAIAEAGTRCMYGRDTRVRWTT